MMVQLLKTYTIQVTIQEGNDEFWQELNGKTGCDQILEEVEALIRESGFIHSHVALTGYELKPPQGFDELYLQRHRKTGSKTFSD